MLTFKKWNREGTTASEVISAIDELSLTLSSIKDKFLQYVDTRRNCKFDYIFNYLTTVNMKMCEMDIKSTEEINIAKSKDLINDVKNSIKRSNYNPLKDDESLVSDMLTGYPKDYFENELDNLVAYLKDKKLFQGHYCINERMCKFLTSRSFTIKTVTKALPNEDKIEVLTKISYTPINNFFTNKIKSFFSSLTQGGKN